MIDERYLYEIHPHRPIKNLIPGRAIVRPSSMKLTKAEVKICMSGGPVFRLFPGKSPIRVVGSNLDQLHVAKYEEYEKLTKAPNKAINDEECTRATEGVANKPKTEAPTETISEKITPVAETEKIPEDIEKFVNLDKPMYEVNTDILRSSITGKTATVSVQSEFPAGSSVEDVIRIKEEATKELSEKSAEKMKELDTPDPEPVVEEVTVSEEEINEDEEPTEEDSFEEAEVDSDEEDNVEVDEEENHQSSINPVSINVGGYRKHHKKNRH